MGAMIAGAESGVALRLYRGDVGDVGNPRVFFDISLDGEPAGRVTMRLRKDIAPKTVENFRQL
jgi:hypothetical protein